MTLPARPGRKFSKTGQFWLAWTCALLLLGMQSLGHWHRISHAAGLVDVPRTVANASSFAGSAAFSDSWGHRIGDVYCQLFDHLCDEHALTGEALQAGAAPQPPLAVLPAGAGADLALRWKHRARGPPLSV